MQYKMRIIKVRDEVYKKLAQFKGDRSFSDVIEELIEESVSLRKKLERYFGILSEEEAKEILKAIEESRRLTDERIRRVSGLLGDP